MGIRELLRRRPVTVVVAVMSAVVVAGLLVKGWGFLLTPIPISDMVAGVWFTCNLILSVLAFCLLWRNLHTFEDKWDWQELAVVRGMLLWLFGAFLGYLARAFAPDPTLTIGTPLSTIGLLLIIQGAIRPPERFEGGDVGGQGSREDGAGPR